MINLPKPSELSMKGKQSEQLSYLLSYLKTLVNELERALAGVKSNKGDSAVTVTDVSSANNCLIISYSDGSKKRIEISDR